MPVGAYSRGLLRRAVSSVRGRVLIAGAVVLLVVMGAFAAATDASKGRPKHAPLSKKASHAAVAADHPGGAPGKNVTGLWTRDSRTYQTPGGQMVARLFAGAVNYKNTHGRWVPIRNQLVDIGGGVHRNTANAFFAQLPGELGKPVRFSAGGDWVAFSLRGAQGNGS